MNELFELGKSIRKQLVNKKLKHHITSFGALVTGGASDEISLKRLMNIINGYDLEVDLSPLAKAIEDNELHIGLQILLGGMLSE